MAGMARAVVMLVAALLVTGLRLVQAECHIDGSVKDKTQRLEQENLLQTLSPIMGTSSGIVKDNDGNTYEFSVCSDLKGMANVSLAQTNKKLPLGYNTRTLVSSDKHWLMLTFLGGPPLPNPCNGSKWEGHVLFICDQNEYAMNMKVLDDPKLTLKFSAMFVVRHHSVCLLSEKGLSGGAIFLIIVLVTFSMYFTFGFFYLRLVRGAKGIEQIPNRTFWFKVGNMLADCCEAVCRCDRYCGVGERPPSSYSGYSPIDEQFAQDLQDGDRDSALLSP